MKINTSASGKVFLSGEYMALEGGRALILSTPQEAKVFISNNSEKNLGDIYFKAALHITND